MRQPSLAIPHIAVPHIGSLDFAALRAAGLKGIVFDKDNTLTAPYVDTVHPAVQQGLDRCLREYTGRVCILSNSAGTDDDVGHACAEAI